MESGIRFILIASRGFVLVTIGGSLAGSVASAGQEFKSTIIF